MFAEEVEQRAHAHPAVADALVVGRPSERWGRRSWRSSRPRRCRRRRRDDELRDHCRRALAGYKVPKAFVWVDQVVRSPAGKPDYAWARHRSPTADARRASTRAC